jgi:biopolymer transport protein ExbD
MSGLELSEGKPNLTPILDVVFQLVTFFMLVANFKAAAIDTTLKLPVVGSARPVEIQGERHIVLNIDKEGELRVYGRSMPIKEYINNEMMVLALEQRRINPDFAEGDELPVTVVIRADRATPFPLLNRVIRTCQAKGFRKFALKAMNKEEQG